MLQYFFNKEIMTENTFKSKNVDINYFSNNVDNKTAILFIHGWQGGWEVWKTLIDAFSVYKIYAVDLLKLINPIHKRYVWNKDNDWEKVEINP